MAQARNVTARAFLLNLARLHCVRFTVEAHISLDAAQLELLRQGLLEAGQDDEWPWIFASTYTISRVPHGVQAWIDEGEGSRYHLDLSYRVRAEPGFPSAAPIDALLPSLSDQKGETDAIRGTAQFSYSPDEGHSNIQLPQKIPIELADSRAEVRGFRLALIEKADDSERLHEVIVDRPGNGPFIHTMAVEVTGVWHPHVPQLFLDSTARLSGRLFQVHEPTRRKRPHGNKD